MLKQLCVIMLLALAGCSSNNHFSDIATSNVAGQYFNDDGFGNQTNLILHDNGRYESTIEGVAGVTSYSQGTWSNIGNKISFSPESNSDKLKLSIQPMEVVEQNHELLLVPVRKVNLHQQLMANFGKSTYTYNR
ncbi:MULTISPECIES: hypothetical protein [Shewanella]|uniref:Lipoprotein n=1 Tax=Shewanella japonica TaxID=93973 RepID=A0ABM6JIE0_9GAMM|nr:MULTISPECIES: hypothetical protein [Shewanella]ARD21934.1 hypothetical protein SJ2017_1621 [Shewanella japonica]